jgi:hypothetical protein
MPNNAFRLVYSTFLHRGHDNRERARESIEEHWPYYERVGRCGDDPAGPLA